VGVIVAGVIVSGVVVLLLSSELLSGGSLSLGVEIFNLGLAKDTENAVNCGFIYDKILDYTHM
jgi:hypothetical protein